MKVVILITIALLLSFNSGLSQDSKTKKALIIGIDGIIHSVIDYASTPGMDQLVSQGSYSMQGFAGTPANSASGWATLMTGVFPDKHRVIQEGRFEDNNFNQYLSIVERLKTVKPNIKIASIVRNKEINDYLNFSADIKLDFNSDEEVFSSVKDKLQQDDFDIVFVQFSSPKEVGDFYGYHLRLASYVKAVQKIDNYIEEFLNILFKREDDKNEDWAVFMSSTHGGTESGKSLTISQEVIKVPIIFYGKGLDAKELMAETMAPIKNIDNYITIRKSSVGEVSYINIPVQNTQLQGMDKYTIEMWIKPGTNSSDPVIIGDKDWDSGANTGFILARRGASWKFNFANDKRSRYDINSTRNIEDGNWHHIAISFDKTKECVLYQDGDSIASTIVTYKESDNMISVYNNINLAQDGTGVYDGGYPNWNGSFNEVRIWSDVLSEETIKEYMFQSNIENSQHPDLESLILYLKMDETGGTFIRDYSGKENHAELIGPESERHPYYPVSLTDVTINLMNFLNVEIDQNWNLDGSVLKVNVPYRLFKVR